MISVPTIASAHAMPAPMIWLSTCPPLPSTKPNGIGYGAGNAAEHAGLSAHHPFGGKPSEGGRCRREVRRYKCAGCQPARTESAARIEAEPADPQKACPDETDHDIMRLHRHGGIADP